MTPTREQLEKFVRESLEKGAVGVKIMGGHWPLPLETSRELVKTANDMNAYVAWHAGSHTAGSNILGMREVIEAAKGQRLHLAHINAYCRGRVNPVDEESKEAIEMLRANPNLWCEAYVSPNNGTVLDCDEDGQIIDHVTRTCLETFGLTPDAAGMREAFLTHRCFAIADTGFMSELVEGEAALELWEKQGMKGAGSFPVNPALSRFMVATAKREDGSFVVDAISTDGGCIPRNVAISVGLSLVKFGALTLPEFVVKTSVNPARHLRLHDRGHLSEGAAADITVFDYDRQQAVETIVAGKSVMKNGEITGTGITLVTTKAGIPAAERNGFKWIETEFESPEPERYIP
ncbi:MAG: amidohydrolase family protein, partial [Sutterella wadsworthensis]